MAASKDSEVRIGRPTDYNDDLVISMCERIASGESVRSITSDEEMPAMATFFRWLNEKPEFKEQYATAKELGAEALFAEIIGIADDGTNDLMEKIGKDGGAIGYQTNGEVIARSRLRVDTRKWYLSKVLPKVYGDKQTIENTHSFSQIPDDELNNRIKALENELKSQD
mgnify:CR=1 FL=1|jgi:hypothetical protein